MRNILVIVAHTDDEAIGLGGTIARHVEQGDRVFGLSMTNGLGSRDITDQKKLNERANAASRASKKIGLQWLDACSFPDNAMDTVPLLSVIKEIEKAKQIVKPTLIYTHSPADLNIDHRIVSQATITAFRPQPDEDCLEIRLFEVASATDYGHRSVTDIFSPNLWH
jgi:LmbE family N-acetylglucosaminyl deacetylase